MRDTSSAATQKMEEMIRKKTPAQRLEMGFSMFDLSKKFVLSAILRQNRDLSPRLIRRELFKHFYGGDFPPKIKEKILSQI